MPILNYTTKVDVYTIGAIQGTLVKHGAKKNHAGLRRQRENPGDMTDLKPCPFCGGKAHIIHEGYWIMYEDCQSESGYYETKEEAIEAWNRRDILIGIN